MYSNSHEKGGECMCRQVFNHDFNCALDDGGPKNTNKLNQQNQNRCVTSGPVGRPMFSGFSLFRMSEQKSILSGGPGVLSRNNVVTI